MTDRRIDRHVIISISLDNSGGNCTARARCACGNSRQAGSYSTYPGRAGAIVQVTQRFTCSGGQLSNRRIAMPFPADLQSVEAAVRELDRKSADLRTQAETLLSEAAEYEIGSSDLRRALEPEQPGPSTSPRHQEAS